MAVALTIDGQSHFFNYGVASRETGTPVSEQTLFEIGSISKTFTATLALYAQELGVLSMDDHPGRYITQLRDHPIDQARLLDLGLYTAGGLPLQFPDQITEPEGMIRYFQRWTPDAEPGTERRYSNPSIGLLGHITGLALGRDFTDVVESRLLPELGIEQTRIRVPDDAMPRYAWGSTATGDPIRVGPGMFDAEAYGIKSSAADMIRFVQLNIDPTALEGPLRHAIEGTQVGYVQVGGMVQGIGWEQYPYPVSLERLLAGNSPAVVMEPHPVARYVDAPGPTLYNKTGSTNGFGAYVAFVPERRIGIVMLANRNFPVADRVRAIHAILTETPP